MYSVLQGLRAIRERADKGDGQHREGVDNRRAALDQRRKGERQVARVCAGAGERDHEDGQRKAERAEREAQRYPDTADGGSRRVVTRIEPTRRRQAARWPRGRDGSGPGARPCSAARASRPRRAKASWRERGACGHAAVWKIFARFYRGCCKKLSRHRCTARPRRE